MENGLADAHPPSAVLFLTGTGGANRVERVACELCGSKEAAVVFRQRDLLHRITNDEFTVVRCADCAFLYLNPRPTQAEIGRFYPPGYFGPPSPPRRVSRVKRWIMEDFYGYPRLGRASAFRLLRKALLWPEAVRRAATGRTILPWIGLGRLLDVGCGHGVSTAMLQQQGWDVQGLDCSETSVAQARTLLGDRVRVGDLQSVHYPDRSFDVVLMSHSLEHMYEQGKVLAEVRRILDDEGQLVIAVPNADSLEAKLFGRWWVNWDPPRHLYHFSRSTLTTLLKRAGFSVVNVRTGVTPAHFMTSLERVWRHAVGGALPARRAIEKFLAHPLCFFAGNVGQGTELIVYAVKEPDSVDVRDRTEAAVAALSG